MPDTRSPRTRLYVETPLASGVVVPLTEGQFHQVKNVQRLDSGAMVALFDGLSGEWLAELRLEKKSAVAKVTEQRRAWKAPLEIDLLFASIKSARLDFMIEKATELGVTRLRPVVTERTQVGRVNTRRLQENAREAAEQSGRMELPVVEEPEKLPVTLAEWPHGRRLYVCAETGEAIPFQDAVAFGPAAILIGPEGGFSSSELASLRALPFVVPVSLGPRILRSETAAIAALTCWQVGAGDWKEHNRFAATTLGNT